MSIVAPNHADRPEAARIMFEDGSTASAVIDLAIPWPDPQQQPVYRDERHYRQAEAALSEFERTGDFRHGLAALVHSILAIEVREAGANHH
jgi:hypothetical protein